MAGARWLTNREQSAWRTFIAMNAKVHGELQRSLQRDSGLSGPDYEVLVALSEAPDGRLRIFEMARELEWEKSRLSHHLSRMERRGLVRRSGCNSDGRGAFVAVSKRGRAAIERAAPAHVADVRRVFFDALTPTQIAALTEIGASVLAHLDELSEVDEP